MNTIYWFSQLVQTTVISFVLVNTSRTLKMQLHITKSDALHTYEYYCVLLFGHALMRITQALIAIENKFTFVHFNVYNTACDIRF